jgi:hypothetical protein
MTDWYYEARGGRVGPLSFDGIRSVYASGQIGDATLVWTPEFGAEWRRLSSTGIPTRSDHEPPPLPPSHLNNTFGWLIATVPLTGIVVEGVIKNQSNSPLLSDWRAVSFSYFAIYTVLCILDARQVDHSGRNSRGISVGSWFWIIPIYLIQRARAVGQRQFLFAGWLVCFLGAIYLENPDIFTGKVYFGFGIPPCDGSSSIAQIKDIFPNIPAVKITNIRAIDVDDVSETSKTDEMRSCKATVITSISSKISVSYTITKRDDQHFYYELRLAE